MDEQPASSAWEARTPDHRRRHPPGRPLALWAADLLLVILIVFLLRLSLGALLVPGFVRDPASVPPFIANAALCGPCAVLAFGLPALLAALVLVKARLPSRVAASWPMLVAAWLGLAALESPLASADFTANVLVAGIVLLTLMGVGEDYLRRLAGLPAEREPWSRGRRAAYIAASIAVGLWLFAYMLFRAASVLPLLQEHIPQGWH